MLFCFSIYKPWGFQNKALSIIKYFLLEQVAPSNHRNPTHTLFWCYQLLAQTVCHCWAQQIVIKKQQNLWAHPLVTWFAVWRVCLLLVSSQLMHFQLWVIRNTCSFPVLQTLMHRLSSDQGCLQCCQTQAGHCYQAFVAPRLKICNLLNAVLVMGPFFPTGTWTSRHFIPMDTLRKKKNFRKSF